MPTAIYKLAEDAYCAWSTVVDAPVSWIMTRAEALTEYAPERIARADTNGHSYLNTGPMSVEELISINRAGRNEEHLTLTQILEQYAAPIEETELPEDDA